MNLYSVLTPADPLPPRAHRKGRRYAQLSEQAGQPIVTIPLPCGRAAVANAPDFERVIKGKLSDQWLLNRDGKIKKNGEYNWYVRATGPNGLTMVAREILGSPPGKRVRYRDGNPLNLRRSNLYTADYYQAQQETGGA